LFLCCTSLLLLAWCHNPLCLPSCWGVGWYSFGTYAVHVSAFWTRSTS
jgi:hypothetical protein